MRSATPSSAGDILGSGAAHGQNDGRNCSPEKQRSCRRSVSAVWKIGIRAVLILALRQSVLIALFLALGACSTLRYTAHVAHGQAELLVHRQPVARIVADPNADASLRSRLRNAQAARAFASDQLALPRNRSYTSYVDLGRPFVTWNVFATAEFSVDPLTHCFPFAGCVAYLGFFDRERAEKAAKDLAEEGMDTQIEGAAAYSTLGWFADPILSSMLRWDDDELDGMIFHELAHQQLYVKDDTAFNESYASFVQAQGLREWHAAQGVPPAAETHVAARDAAFTNLVLDLRERLREVYTTQLGPADMRVAKRGEIAAFRERYARLRDREWNGDAYYDRWVDAPINNARLVPFGLYDRWVPAFARLFEQSGRHWPAFHTRIANLARMPKPQRDSLLSALVAERANEP
jgi:predicted aminopeptidase